MSNRNAEGVKGDDLAQLNSEYCISVTEGVMLVCCFQQDLWHLLFIFCIFTFCRVRLSREKSINEDFSKEKNTRDATKKSLFPIS